MNHDDSNHLIESVKAAEQKLLSHINHLGKRRRWLISDDPVKTQNLDKMVNHLQCILMIITHSNDAKSWAVPNSASLQSLLNQINNNKKPSFNHAWEMADLLEIELVHLGDASYLYTLLQSHKNNGSSASNWTKYFPSDYLDLLAGRYKEGRFEEDNTILEVRCCLAHILQRRFDEYHHDCAISQLRGVHIAGMTLILALLLFIFIILYVVSRVYGDTATQSTLYCLPLALFAGAIGSVFSRIIKLSKQPMRGAIDKKPEEVPLGIRSLISGWKVFIAQPFIGATTALILFLVFSAGLLRIGSSHELVVNDYAIIGFLAGFSEPFFIGILDKVAGQGGVSLR